jgi:hypothetical protein
MKTEAVDTVKKSMPADTSKKMATDTTKKM